MNNKNTVVYIRSKGKRPAGFEDPVPFSWNTQKDEELWKAVSNKETSESQEFEIDWEALTEQFGDVPQSYLKLRTYTLISTKLKKLGHMKKRINQFIDSKGSNLDDLESELTRLKLNRENSNSLKYIDQDILPKQLKKEVEQESELIPQNSNDDQYKQVLSKLQSSKILETKLPLNFKNKLKLKDSDHISDNDMSSSLSVSTSALEEALLERLPFNSTDP